MRKILKFIDYNGRYVVSRLINTRKPGGRREGYTYHLNPHVLYDKSFNKKTKEVYRSYVRIVTEGYYQRYKNKVINLRKRR